MEVSIPANNINTQNIYFADKKKNIIVDGDFIKILYSTESFEMNGLYIFVELEQHTGAGNRKENMPFLDWTTFSTRVGQREYDLSTVPGHREHSHTLHCSSDEYEYNQKDTTNSQNWIQITGNRNSVSTKTKRVVLFNQMSLENISLINRLCQIEQSIIERYIRTYCPFKNASYILKNQLMNGAIKYHSENVHIGTKLVRFDSIINANYLIKERFILKISGVWETATNVGITMKFILMR
jgi:hypothetical protein